MQLNTVNQSNSGNTAEYQHSSNNNMLQNQSQDQPNNNFLAIIEVPIVVQVDESQTEDF